MRIVPPQWRWTLKDNQRCPCFCGGEGYLVFALCPGCAHLVLVCSEVGTVFADPKDTTKESCGHWLDSSGGRCPKCRSIDLTDFRLAVLEELEAGGFTHSDLADIG
jgi:hypothetical protein